MLNFMTTLKRLEVLVGLIFLANNFQSLDSWTLDVEPKFSFVNQAEKVNNFFGNITDFFKILDQDNFTILIGAKNAVYNLSLDGLRENYKQRIEWSSTDADRELCALKGKQEQDCQNYIRVFAKISNTKLLLCGTNSYKPRCRYYTIRSNNNLTSTSQQPIADSFRKDVSDFDETVDSNSTSAEYHILRQQKIVTKQNNSYFDVTMEVEAQGRCPYNPNHNSTYIYTDGQLYSATVADFSGADPLIYRDPLRTEQYDLKQLNQPAFVSALERNGYVFFFFREIAIEYMNCGKSIYSRVGRVCKNDRGGPHGSNDRWTSFLKARLNCSVSGEYPFYFDEIQSTSQIIDGFYHSDNRSSIIYAVFTTSINAIPGSAVCAFNIDDILEAFKGRFKFQSNRNSNWSPISQDQVPEPRPGMCVDDSRTLSSTSANFIKTHSLMEQPVPSLYDQPLLTRVRLQYRLTAITVDPQILALDGNTYDVIFAGTDSGEVVKFIYVPNNDDKNIKTVVIAELQALPKGMAIKELTISHATHSLIVVGDGHIASIPLHQCSLIIYCISCLQVQDPYCVWDINNQECKAITSVKALLNKKNFIQSLNSTEQSKVLCEKYGDIGNGIDDRSQHPMVYQSTRGTLSSIGKPNQSGGNGAIVGTNPGAYRHQKITLTLIDPADIDNTLKNPLNNIDHLVIKDDSLNFAGHDNYFSYLIFFVSATVFIIGIFIGWYSSKKLCKSYPFHAEQRNQLNSKSRPFNQRNNGKDVNLLMNTNPFSTSCNNKKDNLENDFTVGESHKCKNTTPDNLEKELHKTENLAKVKRTYI